MKAAWTIAVAAAVLASPAHALDANGLSARVDALLLTPSITGAGFGNIFQGVPSGTSFDGNLDDDLEGGVRFVLAKEHCSGTGVRFRYFDYDNNVGYSGEWEGATNFVFSGETNIEVNATDLEVTQRGTFHFWDLVASGGVRFGEVDINQGGSLFIGPGTFYGIPSGVDFDGAGPTFSLEADRPLGNSGLALIGRARVSLLFGDTDVTPTFGTATPPISSFQSDDFVQVTEFQFGLNYERQVRGANASFGVFWEAQRWDSDSNYLGDLGLHGLSLQTGVGY